jgi:hypothetical protein
MNPAGNIVMSHVTYQMMGEPAAFLILYDKTNNRIGLKPPTLTTRDAYPARVSNRSGENSFAATASPANTASTCPTRFASTTPT